VPRIRVVLERTLELALSESGSDLSRDVLQLFNVWTSPGLLPIAMNLLASLYIVL
jgi:hypothetical protein